MTRPDITQLYAWQDVVAFNNRYSVGSVVKLRTGELKILSAQGFVLGNGVAYIVLDGVTIRLSEVCDGDDADDKNHGDGAVG